MKWINGKDDPLMFIETMSAQETRAYVKRVMTYYWMYNRIAGKTSKTLEDTARGYWPRYQPTYGTPVTPAAVPAQTSAPPTPGSPSQAQPPAQALVVSDASLPH
jgi:hypothetical protein